MILCVYVREFAACLERINGELPPQTPLIVMDYSKRPGKVVGASLNARRVGVQQGQSLSRAHGFCPNATVISANLEQYQTTLDALLKVSWIYTNMVELEQRVFPNALVLYLDIGHLNADGVHVFCNGLIKAFQDKGLITSVGAARGKFPAQIAAQMANPCEYIYIPPGQEAETIAPAPTSLLPASPSALRTLNLLNITTLEKFAALPRAAVLEQFGRGGKRLHLLAEGIDTRGVKPQRMPVVEIEKKGFETPIINRRQWRHNIKIIANKLAYRLNRRVAAAHELTLILRLDDHTVRREQIYTLVPVETAAGIRIMCNSLLKRIPLTAGLLDIEVQLSQLVDANPEQLELFTRKPRRSDIINLAMVLNERYGARVYQLALHDPHLLFREGQYTRKLVGT